MKTFLPILFTFAVAAGLSAQTEAPPNAVGTNTLEALKNDASEAVAPAAAETAEAAKPVFQPVPFETYRPIIDRWPFGKVVAPPPPPPPPPPPETSEQDQQVLARTIRLQAIVKNPDGRTAVGFSDQSVNPPVLVYLAVGDPPKHGFKLDAADYAAETATITKDGVTITIKLGTGLIPTVVSSPMDVAANTPAVGGRIIRNVSAHPEPPTPPVRPEPIRSRFDSDSPENWPVPGKNLVAIERMLDSGVKNTTYRERLEQRKQELLAERAKQDAENQKAIDEAAAEAEERTAEAFMTMMRRANLENIRNGGEGLGIPLTAEENEMLTREGAHPNAADDD